MIKELQHKEEEVSIKIRSVFQASYKVEAKILKAIDFPPLKRPLEDFINCNTEFYGYFNSQQLSGVIEIDKSNSFTLIRSLVVHPHYFKQGIASQLIEFSLSKFDTELFVVETGVGNEPAINLYKKFGFIEVAQWDIDHIIRKIKFELKRKIT